MDPLSVDERTEHEAMSVISGQKYAANAWIHMYEYKSEVRIGGRTGPYDLDWGNFNSS